MHLTQTLEIFYSFNYCKIMKTFLIFLIAITLFNALCKEIKKKIEYIHLKVIKDFFILCNFLSY